MEDLASGSGSSVSKHKHFRRIDGDRGINNLRRDRYVRRTHLDLKDQKWLYVSSNPELFSAFVGDRPQYEPYDQFGISDALELDSDDMSLGIAYYLLIDFNEFGVLRGHKLVEAELLFGPLQLTSTLADALSVDPREIIQIRVATFGSPDLPWRMCPSYEVPEYSEGNSYAVVVFGSSFIAAVDWDHRSRYSVRWKHPYSTFDGVRHLGKARWCIILERREEEHIRFLIPANEWEIFAALQRVIEES